MTGIVPLPPFPLDWRNHDEQRTNPTNIPADTKCSLRQRGLQEIYRKEKAAEKKATQVDSLRCCAACIGPAYCADKADYDNAIHNYKEKSLYDTGVTAEYGDKLITLVTCSYHEEHGRFVVVARQR